MGGGAGNIISHNFYHGYIQGLIKYGWEIFTDGKFEWTPFMTNVH